ncbi:ribonuclease P protein component 4 [Candidatus Methanoplasma termitum]|uniref:Ribonuclease P protein component 4 n=1 Tax=Candidatus Methanoplasma termitum TaxID=1577791 RepID=A0A0A7LAI8_9ARCH|nr:ribonuclease P protein component 4 [Candidatus Methanoplasma termitum]AIZ56074.1 ribonuclease P protein component 4 [Candidatus Methanoplasma termitum]MCL2333796.1 ribonuclease P protein component 4 [Candidatus Methanoplasma sp.]
MSKKRISKNAVAEIGVERISKLTELSKEALADDRPDLAVRYVSLARAIGRKTRTKMPEGFRYCKKCLMPLVPGVNCTVRLTAGKVVTTCQNCGGLKRKPYTKERKK